MTDRTRAADPLAVTAGRASLRRIAEASERIDRVELVLNDRVLAMLDAMTGHPPGKGFDGDGRGGAASFCEVHGRDRCPCGAGTPARSISDPTGSAAERPDQAKADHDLVVALTKKLATVAIDLENVMARWTRRASTEYDRGKADGGESRPMCSSCSRTEVSRGISRGEAGEKQPVVNGEKRWLCRWCYKWLCDVGTLPTVATLEDHHRGRRVRRPA